MTKRVLIITGPAGDAQGWGDLDVTQSMCDALNSGDKSAEIVWVETKDEFLNAIDEKSYDIIWSALYYISTREDIIGVSGDDDPWLADIFDAKGLPYIGPDALTMKQLIQKHISHQIMKQSGVLVPNYYLVDIGQDVQASDIAFPSFVKPSTESRSMGISDDSVVNTPAELAKQVNYIHHHFQQAALVEDYLPGQEYTVLLVGSGDNQEYLPGTVHVNGNHFKKYPILRTDLRGVGLTKIKRPESRIEEAKDLARKAVTALNCLDHVRIDMRVATEGKLKVIEVNGIPGMKPIKSWSPQIFTLYYPSSEGHMEDYRRLVHRIVDSGLARYGLA